MKYIYGVLFILSSTMAVFAQQAPLPSGPNKKFGFSVHQPYFTGNNVYAEHHDRSIGFAGKAGFSFGKSMWLDIRFSHILSRITDKLLINSPSTRFTMIGIQFSRDWQPVHRVHLLPMIYYNGIWAKNQGWFTGHGVGVGLELEFYFLKDYYIIAGGQYSQMFLNISAPSDIEKQFSRGQFFSVFIGTGGILWDQ